MTTNNSSRREFLKASGVAAGTILSAASHLRVHAAGDETIHIALVGCGGRGCGAAINALNTKSSPLKLIAAADVFPDRLKRAEQLSQQTPDKVDLPPERRFAGYDSYKKAIDCLRPGDVVLLATPPGFRPLHVEYAVKKGVHVFMEKPFATDSPGTRRIQAAAKLADEKNVKIACGLMWRHCKARKEVVDRIHNGEIGELTLLRGFRMHNSWYAPNRSAWKGSELEYQIRSFHGFDWIGASLFIDYCIHNIDVACWAKGAWPVSAVGLGGRSTPDISGTSYDSYYTEFTFPDGSFLTSHGRYINNCFARYQDYAHGTKGSALLMGSLGGAETKIYKNQQMAPENVVWAYPGKEPNPYQIEHDLFFDAIVNNKPYNEGYRAADANFASLLSRAAINTGQIVTWDQIVKSEVELLPGGIDNLTADTQPPVLPNETGHYPYAIPGKDVKI
ncbi:MAG: Gfo/Idh/MocA family oxidoreductase [Planctomycetaceae bacterium]|jgi:predicted dehydrogenase|nr:Gfo/Idh/MocA family oxidoreductase [Planctomycetaceae bacterium]